MKWESQRVVHEGPFSPEWIGNGRTLKELRTEEWHNLTYLCGTTVWGLDWRVFRVKAERPVRLFYYSGQGS